MELPMSILNLTQHVASKEQVAAGVIEPDDKKAVQDLLTFVDLPTVPDIVRRARNLAGIAKSAGVESAMIGGAGWLLGPLERALQAAGIWPLHSFTRREAVEEQQPDGSVKKIQTFRHVGFVRAV
jgi:hypothetical protein